MRLILVGYLILCPILSAAETHLISPEWEINDDFEETEDTTFWSDGAWSEYGAVCPGDSNFGKSLVFDYLPETPEAGSSFSEKRFNIPINAVQIEFSFDRYTPSNYIASKGNHKNFFLWSGDYGVFNSNITVASVNWPADNGATPSVNLGTNKQNFAHSMVVGNPLMLVNNAGKWDRIHVYIELAKEPGEYGRVEISKNGYFLTGNLHPGIRPDWGQPDPAEQIEYVTVNNGNYIDQGYLFGWSNGGFAEETQFCIDNFVMRANSTFRATTGEPTLTTTPKEPTNLNVQ